MKKKKQYPRKSANKMSEQTKEIMSSLKDAYMNDKGGIKLSKRSKWQAGVLAKNGLITEAKDTTGHYYYEITEPGLDYCERAGI